jgi:hypothetical protein
MSNSFYYFFSAVPQVLSGILALFGVFVIFKVQTLKSHLFGIVPAILNEMENESFLEDPPKKEELKKQLIETSKRNNITALKAAISLIDNEVTHFLNVKYHEAKDFEIINKLKIKYGD